MTTTSIATAGGLTGKLGTGWISELNPRKGVLTFDNNGKDERVLFLASKVYFFEKRIGGKQALTDFLSEGDPVQFEAVPQEGADGGGVEANPANRQAFASTLGFFYRLLRSYSCLYISDFSYCTWFANLVWKGKRPHVESNFKTQQSTGKE